MPKPPAPAPDSPAAEAPLEELSRDRLSVFLYLCFTPDELLDTVKRLGLTVPGYRQEHLSDIDRADLLADEVRASRHVRRLVGERLRTALGAPALPEDRLEPGFAARLAEAVVDEDGLQRLLWRLLSDRQAEVRAAAGPALDRLVDEQYGEELPEEAAPPPESPPATAAAGPGARAFEARLRDAARELRRAERERDRAQATVAKLKGQLHECRAAAAATARELSNANKAARAAAARAERLEAALAQARGKPGAALAARLRRDLEKAEHRLAALEAERAAGAPVPVAALPADGAPPPTPGAASPGPGPAEAPPETRAGVEDAPPSWLLPVFTREFYDSLRGWDRRIQRAAFKQAHLLAQDHRHPSLRALPLEGLPNLYRVRVATDVRLLYRRGEGNTVELLSLIDREDLDRYIKQAKERG